MRLARPFSRLFVKRWAPRQRWAAGTGLARLDLASAVTSSPPPAPTRLHLDPLSFSTASAPEDEDSKFPAASDGIGGGSLGVALQRRMQTLMRDHAELSSELLEASGGDGDFDADRVAELSRSLNALEPPVTAGRELIELEAEAADLRGLASGDGDGDEDELAAMAAAELEE